MYNVCCQGYKCIIYIAKVTSVLCMLKRLQVYNVCCQGYKCKMYVAKVTSV